MRIVFLAISLSFIAFPICAGVTSSESRSVETFHAPIIEFLAEQDGSFEREVKDALIPVLKRYTEIRSAYLVAVRYNEIEQGVALCLDAKGGDKKEIVNSVSRVFSKLAGRNLHLDIIFLDSKQQKRVKEVARAFYTNS